MSFDKDTRKLLARMVAACRRRLVQDTTDQLRGVFGLYPDGTVLPLDKLTYLSPDQTAAARRLRDLLDHYAAGAAGNEAERRKAAYERMVLEISFTLLNRLAALRLCEERGLVIECVRQGTASAGFQMFERISGGALGGRYDTYRDFLECLFDELALDLGGLFDRMTPQSAVFPTERCMEGVLTELNKPELAHLWTEDETIGWVYQYFNPPEERKAMRDASQAPRNSRELAVRNQFFTPRYVVEFLTDNTLGRIWFEMTRGETALKDSCHYMVRRPTEIFLCEGEETPAQGHLAEELSQEELLRRPVYVPYRPLKDPREIKMLDPASGSMHFGLYAFDLFERIYEEAWDLEERLGADALTRAVDLEPLHHSFLDKEAFLRDVPRLIIERNIHGIDIDPRAVQIAALALWLRAQKTWKNLGIKASDRPQIAKSNIVTAEPMPGEEDMRREFIAGLSPRVLGQLVDVVFKEMGLAGEAGSLLMIEEEIKDSIGEARKQWLEDPNPAQQLSLPGMTEPRPRQRELRFDVKGITDERFWEQAEGQILDALKDYAERAENEYAIRRMLFAEDTARGFAFIDICRKRYDVVLMNPPFGEASKGLKSYVNARFNRTKNDLYAAFIERFLGTLTGNGILGAITSRSGFFLGSFDRWREELLLDDVQPLVLADLGEGVLDSAMVETAAYCLSRHPTRQSVFFRLLTDVNKDASLKEGIDAVLEGKPLGGVVFLVNPTSFGQVPGAPFAYWVPNSVLALFRQLSPLENNERRVGLGLSTKNDVRFVRNNWEVRPEFIGRSKRWSNYANGSKAVPFYWDHSTIVLSEREFAELRAYLLRKFPYLNGNASWILHEENDYQPPVIGWPLRSLRFSPQAIPPGFVFSARTYALISQDLSELKALLAFLSSKLVHYLLSLKLGASGRPEYVTATVRELPIPRLDSGDIAALSSYASSLFKLYQAVAAADETSKVFVSWVLPAPVGTPATTMTNLHDRVEEAVFDLYCVGPEERKTIIAQTDKLRFNLAAYQDEENDEEQDIEDEPSRFKNLLIYAVGCAFGRWDIRYATGEKPPPKLPDLFELLPVCPPGLLKNKQGLPACPEDVPAAYPLRINWDGILVDDAGLNGNQAHRDDIVNRVRRVFDLLGKDKAPEIEQEACAILGVSDLCDYFRKPAGFFQDHLKRYSKSRRKAPIYWPLSTVSGSYTVWLYYHRLTNQTLYSVVNNYVEPKISETGRGIARFEGELKSASGRDASRLMDRLNEGRTFLGELRDLREVLLRIAALPFKPDLNDGVLINAAPFHSLFRLRPWAKDTEDCWKKLSEGEYDWAHLAYTIWPERVREVCKKDRSIAIAHGLEDLYEGEKAVSAKKAGLGRRRKEVEH